MSQIRTTMSIEDLVGSKIVTAEGKKIGRVVDVQILPLTIPERESARRASVVGVVDSQVTPGPEYEVCALIFGEYAWLYRFHVLRPFARTFGIHHQPRMVSWDAVARFERFVVTLKPGHESRIKSGDKDLHA